MKKLLTFILCCLGLWFVADVSAHPNHGGGHPGPAHYNHYHYYGGQQRYGAGYWHRAPGFGYQYYRWNGAGYIPYGVFYQVIPAQVPEIVDPPADVEPDESGFYGEPYGYYYGNGWKWHDNGWHWHGKGAAPGKAPPHVHPHGKK